MATLRHLLDEHRLGLTVYSPDCARSRLWGNLDHAIQDATGFEPIFRRWVNHDVNSAARFYIGPDGEVPPPRDPDEAAKRYDSVPVEELQYGHLFMKLLLSGPSLLTLWRGDRVVERLTESKGATHPAEAGPGTIRGSFWIDSGVCNIMHTSDSNAEVERELGAVDLIPLLAEEEPAPLPLIEARPAPTSYIAHCGLAVLCDLVNRLIVPLGSVGRVDVSLPPSGDAKETNQTLSGALRSAAARMPETPPARLIDAYLSGDVVTMTRLLVGMPLTKWEHFVLQSGAITRDKWDRQPETGSDAS